MNIGIIGTGRLGKLIARYMGEEADIKVYDLPQVIKKNKKEISQLPVTISSLENLCQHSSIIILAVPISNFETAIKKIAPFIGPSHLIIDVCSVKEYPIALMKKHLPKTCSLLGTHPMFGPDSAALTLWGSKIVLTPVRISPSLFLKVSQYLKAHGLKVIKASAKKHDQDIAKTLILTHLIGRTLLEMKAVPQDIDTKGYRRLMKILETVENDSWQLFCDMNNYNSYAKKLQNNFKKSYQKVCKKII